MTMRRLPDGRYTESVDEYHAAWSAIASPFEDLGWTLSSYDPGFVFIDELGHSVSLRAHQAQCLGLVIRARNMWQARAEYAEQELSQAFGLPGTIGPSPGEAARIVQRLRDERAVLRARLVDCRPWVGVCPWPGTPTWSEVIAQRELADDTLEEIKP